MVGTIERSDHACAYDLISVDTGSISGGFDIAPVHSFSILPAVGFDSFFVYSAFISGARWCACWYAVCAAGRGDGPAAAGATADVADVGN
jgi:hypothetical protein